MSSTPPPPIFLGPNPPAPPTHVVVRCPQCKATTKVGLLSPDKTSIHCPRCQHEVPLKHARPFRDKNEKAEPAPLPVKPPPSAETGGEPVKEGKRRSRAKVTRNTHDADQSVKYPATSSFTFYALIGGGVLVLGILGLLGALIWVDLNNQRDTGYESNLKELLSAYQEALTICERVNNLQTATSMRTTLKDLQGRIFALSFNRERMPAPRESERERLRKYEDELKTLRGRYDAEEKRIAAILDGKQITKAIPPPSSKEGDSVPATDKSVAGSPSPPASGSVAPSAPPAASPPPGAVNAPAAVSPPSPASTPPAVALPPGTLTLTIINIAREQATPQFLDHLASLADESPGKITHQWSGDLLTVTIHPVADANKFAAKVRFGRPTQIDTKDRTVTVLANAAQVVEVGGGNRAPATDKLSVILRDLQQNIDPQRRNLAFDQIFRIKPTERLVETTHVLESLLKDADPAVRVNAVRLLPVWSGAECASQLLPLLDDEVPLVRSAVMEQMARLNYMDAADAIAKKCFPREIDRDKAMTSLTALGEAAEDPMIVFLDHNDVAMRVAACRVLRKVGTTKSLLKLAQLAKDDPNPAVVNAAKEALASIAERR